MNNSIRVTNYDTILFFFFFRAHKDFGNFVTILHPNKRLNNRKRYFRISQNGIPIDLTHYF